MTDQPRLLEGLDPQQRAAVTAPRGPVCVLAGAGTGKTRTITHRIAWLVRRGLVVSQQVLAVTFTARAAGEMRTRLRGLGADGVQAQTFHAAAFRQLRYFWPRVVGDELWPLTEQKFRLVTQAAGKLRMATDQDSVRDLATEIEWAKAALLTPERYPAAIAAQGRECPVPPERFAAVFESYEKIKNSARVLDFDDLLLHIAAILEENTEVAEQFRAQYRSFVVDEYQDVTPLQQRVLDAWLGQRDDLTVVGDANQTIYSFAGASPGWLTDFPRRYPHAELIKLERDYRSTPQVVTLANRVIGAAERKPGDGDSGGDAADTGLTLVGQLPDGPEPEFAAHDDEAEEARGVARRIARLAGNGVPFSEMVVLYRVNAQSELYEQTLSEAGIPYQVRGGERFFSRTEVRQAMTALRTAANRGRAGQGELPGLVREVLSEVGLTERAPSGGAALERWQSLNALAELADELAGQVEQADLTRYVAELDTRASAQHPPTVEGVTLASLHAAKGLEWDTVFLVGLVEGTLPIQHADGAEAVEEERRLLYVGVTRARQRVRLSWAASRGQGGGRKRRRSRFLRELDPSEAPAAAAKSKRRERSGGSRRVLQAHCRICSAPLNAGADVKLGRCSDCPSDADQELLSKLRGWRTERARQLRVPAYVVFSDVTLLAIAEQRPDDSESLSRISGVGETKLERFGPDVLELVNETNAGG
ncbi:ATP-dependent DNA helicase UvrD2 [Actinopolyspora erythraea]|uniref:DNA 3'-5' helicase n=1 Tax=Actinopolyspora erythraea TaxID=414996 RepID=A0A099D044_9ACTN|nr:ATP-dependent DNA helicase UvrD2 [Actinopolyspora erythraea]ASU79726.1 ATP-dependent DNA helicase UvrD2 [Actinopolyspora erythraea]KGI79553.1 ATP-dependent DNA helicase [Actinopolyspora erythraea]